MTELQHKGTRRMIAVMQAFADGATVQSFSLTATHAVWQDCDDPIWNWHTNNYRVKPLAPDTFDWSCIDGKWSFYARDPSGKTYLYTSKPVWDNDMWRAGGTYARIDLVIKIINNGLPAKDSLIKRP